MARFVVALSLVLVLCFAASGQSGSPEAEFGFKPYGSFDPENIDTINLLNQNLNVRIPLVSFPQRSGKSHLGFSIVYLSPTLTYKLDGPNCTSDPRTCNQDWSVSGGGIAIVPDVFPTLPEIDSDGNILFFTSDGGSHNAIPNSTVTDGSGYFVAEPSQSSCVIAGIKFNDEIVIITDSTGIRYSYHAPLPGGPVCAGPLVSIEDTNGNKITPSYSSSGGLLSLTDTLGRTVGFPSAGTTTTNLTGCTGSLPMSSIAYTWAIPGPNGVSETYKMCIGTVTINLPNCQNATGNHTERCIFEPTAPRIQSIVLPDGAAWTFGYDSWNGNSSSYAYGDLTQIAFPSGGTISYTWGPMTPFSNCAGTPPYWNRGVQSRAINGNDGQGPHITTYTATVLSGTTTIQTTVQDAAGNQSVHTFPDLLSDCEYYETQARYYQVQNSSQVLLKTVTTQYNTSSFPPLPATITTTWPNGQVSQITKSYDSAAYGNVTVLGEYDYGSGAPGALLSQTLTTYQYQTSSTYKTNNLVRLPASITIQDGSGNQKAQTTFGYDESALASSEVTTQHDSAPPAGSARGNQTSVHRWLNTTGTFLTNTNKYFDTGTIQTAADQRGNSTTYAYSSTFAGAYPTTTTNPLQQSTTVLYDFNSGLMTSTTDPNQRAITYDYDNMWRPTKISYADGGSATTTYNTGSTLPWTVSTSSLITSGTSKTTLTQYDGLGRAVGTELTSDPSGTDYAATTYDALGRKYQVYNPTRCNPATTNCGETTWGYTAYIYDALDRICVVVPPGGTAVSTCPTIAPAGDTLTSYAGRATSVQDEGNGSGPVQRITQVDGLGRLTSVCEVTSSPQLGPGGGPAACGQDITGTGFLTTYSYDALGNLLAVNQGSLGQRTFAYDSMSRLLCAATPETGTATCPNPGTGTYTAGTTGHAYDANGNVTQRTRPAPNQTSASTTVATTYAYDALNRLTQRSYSDGTTPNVMFGYDQASVTMGTQQFNIANSVGRLSWECTLSPTSCPTMHAFSYDPMGRTAQLWECQYLNCQLPNIVFSYDYDLSGDELDYFVGNNPHGSVEYVSTYNGAGRLVTHTAPTFVDATNPENLLTGVQYDPFGHMTSGNLANGLSLSWAYDARGRQTAMAVGTGCASGNCSTNKYRFTISYAPNSDIASSTDTVSGNWTYTYDGLNRLSTGVANNGEGCSWDYDRYGNRWHQNAHSGTCLTPQLTFSGNNNRIDGYSYDADGNLLNDGVHNYLYDAENRIVSVDGGATTYVYDAEGRRFSKTTGGVATETIYDRMGNPRIRGNFGPSEIFVAGMHLGTSIVNSAHTDSIFYYDHDDWLGTERARTDLSGNPCETIQSLPFGDGQVVAGTCGDISPLHFTGKERDSESGLDDFGARYNASTMGRFMTPDPSNLSVDFWLPQTWNRYAYALNNPLTVVDRNGLWPWYIHNEIINEAFPGLSKSQLQSLKTASANVDKDQSPGGAYKHGLSNGNSVSTIDPILTSYYIDNNEQTAEQIQADWIASGHTGIAPGAMTAFGNALHTVTDMTSPAHEKHQSWYGPWDFFGVTAAYHFVSESWISDARKNMAIAGARENFMNTFGRMALQNAIDGLTPQVTHRICLIDENGMQFCQ